MSLQDLPTLAFSLLIASLVFALTFGFFVGRSCAPQALQRLDVETEKRLRHVEEERAKRHAEVGEGERSHDTQTRGFLNSRKYKKGQKHEPPSLSRQPLYSFALS